MRLLFIVCFCFLQIQLFAQDDFMFVFLNTNPNRKEISDEEAQHLQKAHIENIGKLAKEGKLIIAGPFIDRGGIFVLKTNSKAEAMDWLNTDAAIQADRFVLELFPYKPLVGSVCSVGENYEMLQYHFVRFVPNLTKFNIQQEADLMKAHENFLKELSQTGNVVAAGNFEERAGGILVMKGDLHKEVIETDPAVRGTLLELEFKTLYIAKGSFCEE